MRLPSCILFLVLPAAAFAQGPAGHPAAAAPAPMPAASPYAPYAFLLGEWTIGPDQGPPAMIVRFRWGSGHSYLWYSAAMAGPDGREQPHFEGMLLWNGAHRNLDMLLTLDPQAGQVQEKGTVEIEPDGTVVRDITATYSEGVPLPPRGETRAGPAGATVHFRQTFKPLADDQVLTVLTRESADGWVPTFPGSDHLVMKRRS